MEFLSSLPDGILVNFHTLLEKSGKTGPLADLPFLAGPIAVEYASVKGLGKIMGQMTGVRDLEVYKLRKSELPHNMLVATEKALKDKSWLPKVVAVELDYKKDSDDEESCPLSAIFPKKRHFSLRSFILSVPFVSVHATNVAQELTLNRETLVKLWIECNTVKERGVPELEFPNLEILYLKWNEFKEKSEPLVLENCPKLCIAETLAKSLSGRLRYFDIIMSPHQGIRQSLHLTFLSWSYSQWKVALWKIAMKIKWLT